MNYRTVKVICQNRGNVFSNSATGGGDSSTDAVNVDPNQHLAPIIGGSKTFNVVIAVGVTIAVILLLLIYFKQIKNPL